MTQRLALIIEYDGSAFVGWQVQRQGASVQQAVEGALAAFLGRRVRTTVAGRTDAGVHARAQVAAVDVPDEVEPFRLHRGLNGLLPKTVAVRAIRAVGREFDPRKHAVAKTYRYAILRREAPSPFAINYAWHVRYPLDLELMARAAACFVGRHDFRAYCGRRAASVDFRREVFSIALARDGAGGGAWPLPGCFAGDLLTITIGADGFLKQMVRAMVGALVEAGRGRIAPARLRGSLARPDKKLAGPTAPARGLCLWSIVYPDWNSADGLC